MLSLQQLALRVILGGWETSDLRRLLESWQRFAVPPLVAQDVLMEYGFRLLVDSHWFLCRFLDDEPPGLEEEIQAIHYWDDVKAAWLARGMFDSGIDWS